MFIAKHNVFFKNIQPGLAILPDIKHYSLNKSLRTN